MFDSLEVTANRKCWVEKKKKEENNFRIGALIISPTPPIGHH